MVISDTDAVYLYGLDILAEQLAGAERYDYVHDGLGSVRQLLDGAGQIETRYAYDPFGVPLSGDGVPNPSQFTGEAWVSKSILSTPGDSHAEKTVCPGENLMPYVPIFNMAAQER